MSTQQQNNTAIFSMVAIGLTVVGMTFAGIHQWKSNTDRILTLEVQLAAQRIHQVERDNRQDGDLSRVASEVKAKLDGLSAQLKFISEKLIEDGVASNG